MEFDKLILQHMYVNKFKCEKPSLTEFKNGVAFCSVCNKNVYNSEEVSLSELLQSGESICASVPASKIAWLERSVISLGIVAATLMTPIDTFAQNQEAHDLQSPIKVDTARVVYSGRVLHAKLKQPIDDTKVILYKDGYIIFGVRADDEGEFSFTIEKSKLENGKDIYLEIRTNDLYTPIRYTITDLNGIQNLEVSMDEKVSNNSDDEIYFIGLICEPIITKEPKPSGATFRREDLRNGIR